jgi:pimeloyl-ACP methyl ester carboxylesterase
MVDGDRLHFLQSGTGAPCLLVHGSCGGAGQWRSLIGLLEPDFQVYAVDLFGAGLSEPWPLTRKWSLNDDARAINALIDHIGAPLNLIMHSAGGQFSFPVIDARPHDFLSLTFYEPVYFQLLREAGDPLVEEARGIAARYRAAVEQGNWDGAMRGFVDHWLEPGAWDKMPASVRDLMQRGAARLYYEWLIPEWDWPLKADFAGLDLPVLLVKGTETIVSMHGVVDILKGALPRVESHIIEGAGHMGPFSHAQEFYKLLKPHLDRHAAAREGKQS